MDIYVGTLGRYHAGDWETITAKTAREQGISYRVIRTTPEPEEKITNKDLINKTVGQWRTILEHGLKDKITGGLKWNEEVTTTYFTDQINWYGYSGLQLLAAHTECRGLPIPEKATNKWSEDPAYRKLENNQFKCRFSQLFNVELWLPIEFDFTFKTKSITGHDIWCGSSVILLKQLDILNKETFNASEQQFSEWCLEGAGKESNFEQTAKFGLALLTRYAGLSVVNNLPLKLDY